MKKIFGFIVLALALTACNKEVMEIQPFEQPVDKVEKAESITITATLAPKSAVTKAIADNNDGKITATWAEDEHIAILYKTSETNKYMADATITDVDGSGTATISFTVVGETPDGTDCTLIYPLSAANSDCSGLSDVATLLGNQDGTLNANLDVRVGAGRINITTPGLNVTTQPEPQFAIFKFTVKNADGSATIPVKPLTITIGAHNFVITPATATSVLYVALPPISSQPVSFSAKGDYAMIYDASFTNISFNEGRFYQTTLKMTETDMRNIPLTFEPISDDGTIFIEHIPTDYIHCSINGGDKFIIISGQTVDIHVGEKIQFFGNSQSYGNNNCYFETSTQCKVYGNIMSLVDETNYASCTELTEDYAFRGLFANCIITDASDLVLPAINLSPACYQNMFYNCSSLTAAPALPATFLSESCYANMFQGCTSLTSAPDLPATFLSESCYANMFQGCTSLTSAPDLPAKTLIENCYGLMFYGCTNLNAITCLATNIGAANCTVNWVEGVAATGTFFKDAGTTWSLGANGIPNSWTVQDYEP